MTAAITRKLNLKLIFALCLVPLCIAITSSNAFAQPKPRTFSHTSESTFKISDMSDAGLFAAWQDELTGVFSAEIDHYCDGSVEMRIGNYTLPGHGVGECGYDFGWVGGFHISIDQEGKLNMESRSLNVSFDSSGWVTYDDPVLQAYDEYMDLCKRLGEDPLFWIETPNWCFWTY